MTIGIGITLAAIGAILYFAVSATIAGVSINTIGVILMIAGAIGAIAATIAAQRAPSDRRNDPAV